MENLINILYVLTIIIAVVLVVVKPHLVLPLFIGSLPLESLIESNIFSLPKILGLIALAGFLMDVIKKKRRLIFDTPFVIFYIFVLGGAISYFWSVDQQLTLSKIITVIQLLVLYFLIINYVKDYQSLDIVMSFLFMGTIIYAAFGLSDLFLNITNNYNLRLESIARNSNWYFIVAICMIPANYWIILSTKKGGVKLLALIVSLVLLITSLYTQSRGGLISLAVFFLTFLILSRKKLSWLLLIVFLALLIYQIMPEGYLERFAEINSSIRITDLWPAGIRAIQDSPILGYGLGTNAVVIPRYLGYYTDLNYVVSVHNSFLGIFIDNGIFGTIVYLLFIIVPTSRLVTAIKFRPYDKISARMTQLGKILLAVLMAYLASWLKGGGMEYQKMLWFLVGIEMSLATLIVAHNSKHLKMSNSESPV